MQRMSRVCIKPLKSLWTPYSLDCADHDTTFVFHTVLTKPHQLHLTCINTTLHPVPNKNWKPNKNQVNKLIHFQELLSSIINDGWPVNKKQQQNQTKNVRLQYFLEKMSDISTAMEYQKNLQIP